MVTSVAMVTEAPSDDYTTRELMKKRLGRESTSPKIHRQLGVIMTTNHDRGNSVIGLKKNHSGKGGESQ